MSPQKRDPIQVAFTCGGRWAVVHCGQVLATCGSEDAARRTASALERLRPSDGNGRELQWADRDGPRGRGAAV